MKFVRQDVIASIEDAQIQQFDIAFIGNADLDDRSRESVNLSTAAAKRTCKVRYDPARFELHVDDLVIRVDSLNELFRKHRAQSIVLDATTLDFPEILYILRAYRMQKGRVRCGFFYVEPEHYKPRDSSSIVPGNAFDLSTGFTRHPLPAFRGILKKGTHLMAFLGFEGDRLLRVLEEDDGHFYERVSVIFGVPPFQPSWDLHAMMANSSLLERSNTNVLFCGANNPYSAYSLLSDVHEGAAAGATEQFAVAPFGTKPMALGVALYCLEHEIYSPIYDHPIRKPDRTSGVFRRHWYEIDMTE